MKRITLALSAAGLLLAGYTAPAMADTTSPGPCPEGSRITCRVNDPGGIVKPCVLDPAHPGLACVVIEPKDPGEHVGAQLGSGLVCVGVDALTAKQLADARVAIPCPAAVVPVPEAPGPADEPRDIGTAPAAAPVVAHLPVTH